MKKLYKIAIFITCLCIFSTFIGGSLGCGGKKNEVIDDSKIQIYVAIVNNGVGQNWAQPMADEWNAKPENSKYEVIIRYTDTDLPTTITEVTAGVTDNVIHFGSLSNVTPHIYTNSILDLSDVYDMKVDGDDNTIADKTFDFEVVKAGFSDLKNQGIYAIPYATGLSGLVFDYKFFLEKGFLDFATSEEFTAIQSQLEENCAGAVELESSSGKIKVTSSFGNYKEGDYVLTCGKDEKYGTYDDGQRTTIEGFNALIGEIVDSGVYPYIHSTEFFTAYVETQLPAMLAQNMGLQNYKNFMKFNGDIIDESGAVAATLNLDNGYTAYDLDLVENAYREVSTFYRSNFLGKDGVRARDRLVYPKCLDTTAFSHRSAQISYISSFMSENSPDAAFLSDGVWWEGGEAKSSFAGIEQYGTADDPRGYGKREYRYYLYPELEGQITPSNQSVMSCMDEGAGVLLNNPSKKCKTDEEKKAFFDKCKEFLAFTLSNENLVKYTKLSGGIPRPFDYELDQATYEELTPFQKNCWEISHDTEHVTVLRNTLYSNMQGIRSIETLHLFGSEIDGVVYQTLYAAFKDQTSGKTVEQFINGLKRYVNKNYEDYKNSISRYL